MTEAAATLLTYNRVRVAKEIRPGPEVARDAEALVVQTHAADTGARALVEVVEGWRAEPDADPSQEILDVRWCESHSPARDGADDEVVTASAYLSGSAEAGGDDNRRWCDILHGRR